MNWSPRGNAISEPVEVVAISDQGLRIRVRGREYFLSYAFFPWFEGRPRQAVLNVREEFPGHLHWPELDVDLSLEIIEHPERFPLQARR